MKTNRFVLLLCLLFFLPITIVKAYDPQNMTLEDIDSYVQEQMQRSSIPGLSYAIVDKGEIIHLNAFGVANSSGSPMTPQTPLYFGSVGKTFTALAIRQMVNAGLVNLDEPVNTYLPSFTSADPVAAQKITIRHLMNHTSGFSTQDGNDPILYRSDVDSEDLVRLLENFQLNSPAGEKAEYSNINYIILGRVIEVVSGESYGAYVQHNIFNPLEMNDSFSDEAKAITNGLSSGYRYFFGLPIARDLNEPTGAMAAGFLMSSAEDMAHYLIAFTRHGQYNDVSVVNPDGLPHPDDQTHRYNINWLNQKEAKPLGNTETHSGAWLNYSAGITFMPVEQIGVVVLANSFPAQWLPVKDAFAITYDILRLYTGNPPNPPTMPLIQQYLMVDFVLLVIAGLVFLRFRTLRFWKGSIIIPGKSVRLMFPSIMIDLLLPLFVMFVLPPVILESTGHINPIWCWNRLIFQIPDIAWVVLVIASSLLLVGIIKIHIAIQNIPARKLER